MSNVVDRKKVVTSGRGTLEPFSYLTKPDFGNEKFKNDRGVYKASLTLPNSDKDCIRMIKQISETHEAHYAGLVEAYEANPPTPQRGKKPLLPYEGDLPFIDNGDGTTTFKFSCYASYTDKKTKETRPITVQLVDRFGKPIKEVPAFIGGGSIVKIKYTIQPYPWNPTVGASVKLQLSSAMIIEMSSGNGGGDDWGADTEEDYSYSGEGWDGEEGSYGDYADEQSKADSQGDNGDF